MVPRIVGTLAAVVLFDLGTLHCYWAAGGRWATEVTIPKRGGEPLVHTRTSGDRARRAAAVCRGTPPARAPRSLGTRLAALTVRCRNVDARRGVQRTCRRRLSMVRRLQAGDGDAVRVVGHPGVRPTLRPARAGGVARGIPGTLTEVTYGRIGSSATSTIRSRRTSSVRSSGAAILAARGVLSARAQAAPDACR